jgi:ketosteroid isomerase-like protein
MTTTHPEAGDARAVIEGWLDALRAGDFAAMNSFYADDCVMHFPGDPEIFPWAGEKRGIDEILECFSIVAEHLDIRSHDFRHIIVEGDDVVILGFEVSANMSTGEEFTQDYAWHFQVRDGKIRYYRLFEDTLAMSRVYG